MILQRLTFHVKPGRMDEVVEMLKAADEVLGSTDISRIYTPNIGQFDVVVNDLEFENLAELDALWAEWWSNPETPAFMEKWNELVDAGGGSEVWNLVE
jgi:hypothetical protein